jgi:hypothetical protein
LSTLRQRMNQPSKVLSFRRASHLSKDWTQQQLAEFYRVESALLQRGLVVTTERGLSDEGDPWFVFCLPESEEVVAHFARIDGEYVVISSAFSEIARGPNFQLLIRQLMHAHPFMLPRNDQDQNIFLHPAALLAGLLAASYLVSSDKPAAAPGVSAERQEKVSGWFHCAHDAAILSAVMLAAVSLENYSEMAFSLLQDAVFGHDAGSEAHLNETHALAVDHGAFGLAGGGNDPGHNIIEVREDSDVGIFPAAQVLPNASIQSTGYGAHLTGLDHLVGVDIDRIGATHEIKAWFSDANGDSSVLSTQQVEQANGSDAHFSSMPAPLHSTADDAQIALSSAASSSQSTLLAQTGSTVVATNDLASSTQPSVLPVGSTTEPVSGGLSSLEDSSTTSTTSTATSTNASATQVRDFVDFARPLSFRLEAVALGQTSHELDTLAFGQKSQIIPQALANVNATHAGSGLTDVTAMTPVTLDSSISLKFQIAPLASVLTEHMSTPAPLLAAQLGVTPPPSVLTENTPATLPYAAASQHPATNSPEVIPPANIIGAASPDAHHHSLG